MAKSQSRNADQEKTQEDINERKDQSLEVSPDIINSMAENSVKSFIDVPQSIESALDKEINGQPRHDKDADEH